jgi:hypothetical protein
MRVLTIVETISSGSLAPAGLIIFSGKLGSGTGSLRGRHGTRFIHTRLRERLDCINAAKQADGCQ